MSRSNSDSSQENEKFQLKKKIGLWSAVSILCGTIVGSGIFISPVGVLAKMHGSVGLSLVMWVACGLLSGLSALCYAELGTCIRESGADLAYNTVAIGPSFGFLYVWTTMGIIRGTGTATTSIVFASNLLKPFFPNCDPPDEVIRPLAICAILFLTWLHCRSVKVAVKLQIVSTASKFIVLFVIIVVGFVQLFKGDRVASDENFGSAFDPEKSAQVTIRSIGLAFFQGLFSYSGYRNVNYVAEEIHDLKRNLPRAILIAMSSITVCYLLVNIAYFCVLTPEEMLSSKAVAVVFAQKVMGSFAWLIPVGVTISTLGAINGTILTSGRLPFVAARRGLMPTIFGTVHVVYYTPCISVIVSTILIITMLLISEFNNLLNAFGFTVWLFYGLSALNLLILRHRKPDMERPYRVPTIVPIIVCLSSAWLVIVPLMNTQDLVFLLAAGFMTFGFLVYFVFVYKAMAIPGMKTLTIFLQKLTNSALTDWEEIAW